MSNIVRNSEIAKFLHSREWVEPILDYETKGLDMWHPDYKQPIGFSVCNMDADDESDATYCEISESLSDEDRDSILNWFKKYRPYVFNLKFEANVTWSYFGDFVKFNDTMCMLTAWGRRKGLKQACVEYLNVKDWGEIWDVVSFAQKCIKFIHARPFNRISKAIVRSSTIEQFTETIKESALESKLMKYESEFVTSLVKFKYDGHDFSLVKSIIEPYYVEVSETKGKKNPVTYTATSVQMVDINLSHIPVPMVARYCNLDVVHTAKLTRFLKTKVKDEWYQVYLKQAYLSSHFQARGICWNYKRSEELEDFYKSGMELAYRRLAQVNQFKLWISDDTSESDAIKSTTQFETGRAKLLDPEFKPDFEFYKSWWNPSSPSDRSIKTFYSAIQTPQVVRASFAYQVHINFQECDLRDPSRPSVNKDELKTNPDAKLRLVDDLKFNNLETTIPNLIKSVSENEKYEGQSRKLLDIISEAKTWFTRLQTSLDSDHLDTLYLVFEKCMDLNPDLPYEEFPFEFKILYNTKLIKKYLKCLNTYIYGSVGRERVREVSHCGNLLTPPTRLPDDTDRGKRIHLMETDFNECSAETKRWRSPIHTIPWSGELRQMMTTRLDDGICVHFDYSQNEVRVMAKMAGEETLLQAFRDGIDVHRYVASKVWKLPMEMVTSDQRRFAKIASFSILYGKSEYSFAHEFMFGDMEATARLFSDIYDAFPKLRGFIADQHRLADTTGEVFTMYGDPLVIGNVGVPKFKGYNRRVSVNWPIQSGSSSMAGEAGWNVYEKCTELNIPAIPLCFTHDSHDFETAVQWFIHFYLIVRDQAVDRIDKEWGIPAQVDFEFGLNQGNLYEIKKPQFSDGKLKFKFEGCKVGFDEFVARLRMGLNVEYEIKESHTEFMTNQILFMPRHAFDMRIGSDVEYIGGEMELSVKRS